MKLSLNGRYYRMRPITSPGYETEQLELDLEKTALVLMHIWNIGMEDGPKIDPAYAVGMGFPENFAEAERITREVIVPVMEKARQCGMPVASVTNTSVALRDERARADEDGGYGDEESFLPAAGVTNPPARGWAGHIIHRAHGDFLHNPPYSEMKQAKITEPKQGEIYVHQSNQFDRALRKRGIENLIYTGFAADMCILHAAGGAEAMFDRGYRVFLMRDATLGIEYPDTFDQRLATFWAVRFFEAHFGDTITSEEFFEACLKDGS